MRVDLHTHFLPPRFFTEMARLGAEDAVESFAHYGPMLEALGGRQFAAGEASVIDERIEEMDACGVQLSVVSLGALQPYFEDAASAASAARFSNEMLRNAVDMGRGRIAAFGSIPLPHGSLALQELAFCLDECGFVGVNVGSSAGGYPLDAPMFDELWAALDERQATVCIHPGTTPRMAVGSADFHLAPDFCSPTETAIALCRLVTGRTTSKYPRIRFVAAAMGGTIPYLARRFDRGLQQSSPSLYEELGGVLSHLRRFWYDTSMTEEPYAIEMVRQSVGVDRLVFGSDVPRGPLQECVEFVTASALMTNEEKERVLGSNGMQALGL
jgi:predicted TIM-barrel fold metal-dependent hydrolase